MFLAVWGCVICDGMTLWPEPKVLECTAIGFVLKSHRSLWTALETCLFSEHMFCPRPRHELPGTFTRWGRRQNKPGLPLLQLLLWPPLRQKNTENVVISLSVWAGRTLSLAKYEQIGCVQKKQACDSMALSPLHPSSGNHKTLRPHETCSLQLHAAEQ